ncbi:peptidylprolyl isomerase [Clostridium carboxidivorans P7]|uniref:Peptidyl-prolyl cis-trans isomerase n=1 Tax=Clostridium carboxidivorans P7 TaxID=536227 RepID=C6PYF6_9CLOT|nr:peptidylprolyl isomerase [Clostridium carboxidivorans]AKN32666.1 peptidylprolyl isomerase [Clostridium carboxidivorans P7]EET85721.1 Peptidylprolyl isomerase [Clostridium carboxidivorans P7]EFG90102.1 peptidyl-prolyl cis-trans isomerase, cyclophilin-type [Clostridium carboxidivorans P7]
MKLNKIIILLLCVIAAFIIFGCSQKNSAQGSKKFKAVDEKTLHDAANPIATITMENGDEIKVELYPKAAPNTVNNFIYLVNKGFYNGLTFHRVIPKFMIQGGCPKGDGTGGPGYKIKGEFAENGFSENGLKHTRGVISMARSQENDSAGSQFFIMHGDAASLDGKYAAFGKVIKGMDVVDKIVSVDRDSKDKPKVAQVMKKITVETFNKKYGEPETIK